MIIILGLLLEEYRKRRKTKAVLSRLATKNGWKIRFGETFRKQDANFPYRPRLNVPGLTQERGSNRKLLSAQ